MNADEQSRKGKGASSREAALYEVHPNQLVFLLSLYTIRTVARIYFRGTCSGRENYPEPPFIGVFNHSSNLDLVALSLARDQLTFAMAKDSLFRVPVLGWWLNRVGIFPVSRGRGDERSLNTALHYLQKGYAFFMAPEGTRRRKPEERPRPRTGVVRLAQLTGLPVVPVGLSGAFRALPPGAAWPRPRKLRVRVGKPFHLPPLEVTPENHAAMQEQAEFIMSRVYELVED